MCHGATNSAHSENHDRFSKGMQGFLLMCLLRIGGFMKFLIRWFGVLWSDYLTYRTFEKVQKQLNKKPMPLPELDMLSPRLIDYAIFSYLQESYPPYKHLVDALRQSAVNGMLKEGYERFDHDWSESVKQGMYFAKRGKKESATVTRIHDHGKTK